jgi:hypothetical protein
MVVLAVLAVVEVAQVGVWPFILRAFYSLQMQLKSGLGLVVQHNPAHLSHATRSHNTLTQAYRLAACAPRTQMPVGLPPGVGGSTAVVQGCIWQTHNLHRAQSKSNLFYPSPAACTQALS